MALQVVLVVAEAAEFLPQVAVERGLPGKEIEVEMLAVA
jgi:hypothetical protein